jgi:hypothetical protein
MFVVLRGRVDVTHRSVLGPDEHIITHEPGSFMGELAQLSGRPALVDARAMEPVEALVIPSSKLRDVLVAEAELGERIMRALILRRVGLIELHGGGPVIVGHQDDGDVLRLASFLDRNGHPFQILDPETDGCARTLVDKFHLQPAQLPIVLCPNGQMLQNPAEDELARCIGMVGAVDQNKIYDVAIVGAGPGGARGGRLRRVRGPLRHRVRLPRVRRPGRRVVAHRELSRLSDRHHRQGAHGARVQPGAEVRRRDGDPRRGAAAAVRLARRALLGRGSRTASTFAPARS